MAVYDRTSIFVEILRGGWFAASHGPDTEAPDAYAIVSISPSTSGASCRYA